MRVTDEMVNAARSAYSVDRIPNGEIINKIAGPGYGDKLIRGMLEAALSHAAGQEVDGPQAYCRPCQSAGISNCSEFDRCAGATCITCHRPLNAPAVARSEGDATP